MLKKAFRRATALATVLQFAMVLLGAAIPALRHGNVYPIVGTLLALLAGFLCARWSPGTAMASAVTRGCVAGGVSSFLGVLLAALVGQAAPSPVMTVTIATLTGFVAGGVGGFFGRLFPGGHPAA